MKKPTFIANATSGSRHGYGVSITVPGVPLTFIPRWSITLAERAAQDAVQQVSEALKELGP